jgi:hypothetical protein
LAVLILWIVFFPLYLLKRHKARQYVDPLDPDDLEAPEDYTDEETSIQWHRSPRGEWYFCDEAAGWTLAEGVVDAPDE